MFLKFYFSFTSNLWVFVSNFTDHNAKQLYKIYRQAMSDHRPPEVKKENDKMERKSILEVCVWKYFAFLEGGGNVIC